MKKLVLVISFLFLFSAVGFAAPLTDFSQGKASIDLNWRMSSDIEYPRSTFDGDKSNFDLGLTIGLGNKFAFQWQNQTGKIKPLHGSVTISSDILSGSTYTKLTANQFNILYSLDKNIVGFVGYTQAKNDVVVDGDINGIPFNGTISGKTISGWQAGVTGSFPLSDKFSGFGTIGFGNKISSFEFGLSYHFSKDAELNLFYKSTEYKDLGYEGYPSKFDLKVNGPGVGVTFKF